MSLNPFPADYITIANLYIAYRKAKSEAYYGKLHPSALAYAEFEQDLQENLEKIHRQLISGNGAWSQNSNFIGGFLYIPKSINDSVWQDETRVHYRSVDPCQDWQQCFEESGKKRLDAKYRLIIVPTVAYQIVSALWILMVGHKFEGKLDQKLSYANRLRRKRHAFRPFNGSVNKDSFGLFTPYFSAYRNWRQKGLDAMKNLVESGKKTTAVTMDLANFYHNTSPTFLLKPSFLKKINVQLSDDDKKFTRLLLDSISYWYQQTPDYHVRPEGALPVGLSASQIISNVLLYELDNQVNKGLSPTYYGRYVDDIFLVFETPENISNGNTVIEYLAKNVECLKIKRTRNKQPGLTVRFGYAADSELSFTADKQKVFNLSSEHGIDFINQIASQIRAQSSEYRMLPVLPQSSAEMAEKALLASDNASQIADALRKADVISVKRLGFALLIRDIESYSTDLSRSEWSGLRHEFYSLVHRNLVTPKGLFDLFSYYPRIFSLMVANHDFEDAERFIKNLLSCFGLLEKTTTIVEGRKDRIRLCKTYFGRVLLQASLQASTTKNFDEWHNLRKLLNKLAFYFEGTQKIDLRKKPLALLSKQLLLADLGVRPYKDYWYYAQEDDSNNTPHPLSRTVVKVLKLGSIRKFRKAAKLKIPHWPALAFPTRALTIQELALISPSVLEKIPLFKESILALRGAKTSFNDDAPSSAVNELGNCVIVPQDAKDTVYVALTNFETTKEQFTAALDRKPDRTTVRYERINKLVNNILRANQRPDYVVFPECSIPRRWAMSISGKLAKQGISMIAGIEYYEHKGGASTGKMTLRNDCLLSLTTRWPGYLSNFIFMQPKIQPSHGEKEKLMGAKKKQYTPTKKETLPVYLHGNYHFGVVICSDLTTPENRAKFQGKVDSLFVLEFNPDVKTFSYLVEGAAHDIHTFVIQVNNRLYGDSRVRAPYRTDHKQDSVRLKGGVDDYFVIAEIDFQSLRKFQKKNCMTIKDSEFKPVPIGFEMSKFRK